MANSGPPAVQHTAGGNAAFHNFHNDFAHIADPNERRRLALAEIDKAPFGWYHVRACVVAGVGFFTDSYDIFAVSLLTTMLGIVYWPQDAGVIPVSSDTAIKVATSGGTVLGQLGFGALADIIGRKKMYGLELIVIIVATLAQSLSAPSEAISIVGVLIFWRVIMGIGIGGDYPLSSIITSEFATTKWRGAMMAAVFAMQGFGQLTGAIVMVVITAGFRGSLSLGSSIATCSGDCSLAVDKMWRILIGFGAVPACIALYYRLTIPETPRFTFDVARDVEQAQEDVQAYMTGKHEGQPDEISRLQTMQQANNLTTPKASWGDFFRYYSKWKNGKILIGTAGSWFVLDVAFYGLGLNSTTVLGAIGWGSSKTDDAYQILYKLAVGNVILTCAGAIPGYWFSVATIDIVGRKPIQLMGFAILTLLFLVWGFDFNNMSANAMFGVYVLAQFFFNWGPNATTFIIPGECFATRYRSTSHGISAAAGKIGSIIAQAAIAPLRVTGAPAHPANTAAANPWLNNVMKIYAFFMLLGCGTTLLLPETARRTLEELSDENVDPPSVDNGVQEDLVAATKDEKTALG